MILVTDDDFEGTYALAQSIADELSLEQTIDDNETMIMYKLFGKELADLLIANIQLPKTEVTAGLLTVGASYFIKTFVAGDDFTNVGAASNAAGVYFIATGTTPTTWTGLSTLVINRVKRYDDLQNTFYILNDVDETYETFEYPLFTEKLHFQSYGLKDMLLCKLFYIYITEEQLLHTQSGVASQSIENGRIQTLQNVFRKGARRWNTRGLDTWYGIYWLCKYYSPEVYPEFDGELERVITAGIL